MQKKKKTWMWENSHASPKGNIMKQCMTDVYQLTNKNS